jgi:septal ring factor EnvC (AmiA/AmiB activator)
MIKQLFVLFTVALGAWAEEPINGTDEVASSDDAVRMAIDTMEQVSLMEQQTRLTELETERASLRSRLTEIENEMVQRRISASKRIKLAREQLSRENEDKTTQKSSNVADNVDDDDEDEE